LDGSTGTLITVATVTIITTVIATITATATAAATAARTIMREATSTATITIAILPRVALTTAATTTTAAATTTVLVDATGHILGAFLATTVVVGELILHLVTFAEGVAVLDGGEVAEDVVPAALGLDEAEAPVTPPTGSAPHELALATTTPRSAAAAAAAAATAAAAALAVTAVAAAAAATRG